MFPRDLDISISKLREGHRVKAQPDHDHEALILGLPVGRLTPVVHRIWTRGQPVCHLLRTAPTTRSIAHTVEAFARPETAHYAIGYAMRVLLQRSCAGQAHKGMRERKPEPARRTGRADGTLHATALAARGEQPAHAPQPSGLLSASLCRAGQVTFADQFASLFHAADVSGGQWPCRWPTSSQSKHARLRLLLVSIGVGQLEWGACRVARSAVSRRCCKQPGLDL